jgi:hypothetical protein
MNSRMRQSIESILLEYYSTYCSISTTSLLYSSTVCILVYDLFICFCTFPSPEANYVLSSTIIFPPRPPNSVVVVVVVVVVVLYYDTVQSSRVVLYSIFKIHTKGRFNQSNQSRYRTSSSGRKGNGNWEWIGTTRKRERSRTCTALLTTCRCRCRCRRGHSYHANIITVYKEI